MDEESEKIMRSLKEQRMEALKADYQEKQQNKTLGHGTYTEIVESEFLPLVTKTRYVVVAFFHKDFQRCKIIDMHLFKICRDHEEARFVRLDAEKAPFFISKLGIQVLPTVVMFIDGIAQDRIVGFEELGGCDDFSTLVLTRRLIKGGVLYANNRKEAGQIKIKKGSRRNADSDEDY
jgi:thioredoxin-like negative regulator of GroEL